jgi:hypothetical protein
MAGSVPSLSEKDPFRFAQALNELFQGRSNAVGTCTLTAGATTTVVSAENCGDESQVFLFPKTANAAGALATTYITSIGNGTFTITHANTGTTDRTFAYAAIG